MNEIEPNLTQQIFIGGNRYLLKRCFHVNGFILPLRLTSQDQIPDLLIKPIRSWLQLKLFRFERSQLEQIFGNARETRAFLFDDTEIMMSLLSAEMIVFQRLCKPANRCERGLDFVRNIGDEFLPHVLHLIQFERHLIYAVCQLAYHLVILEFICQTDTEIS